MRGGFIWRPSAELVEQANVTRLARRLGADGYTELHRISVEEPERFWPAVVDDLGIEFSRPWDVGARRLARAGVDDVVQRRPRQRRPRLPPSLGGGAAGRGGARLAERGRPARGAELGRGVAAGDAARRGARRARRRAGRPRRDLHADVPGGRRRVARVRARRRGAGADLLRLRGAGDRVAARGLAARRSSSAPTGRCGAGSGSRCGETLDEAGRFAVEHVVEWNRETGEWPELVTRQPGTLPPLEVDSEAPYLLAYTSGTTGRPKGALHVQGGFLVSIAREAAYQSDVKAGDRAPLRHRHGLDHGTVDGGRRRRARRGDRLRRGRARLARRPALAARRVGARDDARPLAHARPRADPARRADGRPLVAADVLHDRASRGIPIRTSGCSSTPAARARRS